MRSILHTMRGQHCSPSPASFRLWFHHSYRNLKGFYQPLLPDSIKTIKRTLVPRKLKQKVIYFSHFLKKKNCTLEPVADEKLRWWDLPLGRKLEEPFEAPEARIGAGEGVTLSHGDAANSTTVFCYDQICPEINNKPSEYKINFSFIYLRQVKRKINTNPTVSFSFYWKYNWWRG